jgi:chloramphenicol O-acetyltransferase type A
MLDYPHFSLCAHVDMTAWVAYVKQHKISVNVAIVYLIARTANEIPAFRYRIRGDEVIEHEVVHPSTTILTEDETFTFCTIEYSQDFSVFAKEAQKTIAYVKEHVTVEDEPGQDDLLFLTTIPWISFTSLTHPINLSPADSVPRISWGRFCQDGGSIKLPLGVQAHHALMDGLHVGQFYEKIQDYLNHPESYLG